MPDARFSSRNLLIAVMLAVLLHGFVLAIKLSFNTIFPSAETTLLVSLSKEPDTNSEEKPNPDAKSNAEAVSEPVTSPAFPSPTATTVNQTSSDQTPKPSPKEEQPTDKLLAEKAVSEPLINSKPVNKTLTTSILSGDFKAFIQDETDAYRAENPETVGEFSQTFEEVYAPKDTSIDIKREDIPAGSTTFMLDRNGRRYCMVKILDLLDISAAPSFVSKDCTPKAKFELDMKKPNNGWMKR